MGGLFASDDAEAAVTLRLLKEAPEAYNALRKQLARDRQKGLSPMRTAEKFIHDQSMTNYDKGFNSYAYKVDGTSSGDYWKSGVQGLYDEILGAVDEPDPMVVEAMDAWLANHVGRETGSTMAQNRAKARAARSAGAGAAATGANAAFADDTPESGFKPWSDYEPEPTYWDRVTSLDTYADALAPYVKGAGWLANTAVGKHIGGQLGEAMEAAQMPGQAVHGLGRGVYGLATGESPKQAFSAGVDVSQNDLATNGQMMRDWATDRGWHEDDAAAAGMATEFLADPLTYAGMGLLGKIKGAL